MEKDLRSLVLKKANPGKLLFSILMYALGVGVLDFLGKNIDWEIYFQGQVFTLALLLGSYYLLAYFIYLEIPRSTLKIDGVEQASLEQLRRLRNVFLVLGISFLTISAIFCFFMIQKEAVNLTVTILLLLFGIMSLINTLPPFQLLNKASGEIIETILLVTLTPAIAFSVQNGDIHRLLGMAVFPLALLYLVRALALGFSEYSLNIKYERKTFLTQMGWLQGMNVHNILILCAFLLMTIVLVFDYPWVLGWPVLLTLPIGVYEIWQMRKIGTGAKPNWRILRLTANTLLWLSTYLTVLTLWIR